MIKLLDLLLEISSNPKAIILAGGAGAGKSTLLKSLTPYLKGFQIINPDKYLEDKNSPFYGNLAKSSNQVDNKDVPEALKTKQNFVWDTTASNANKMLGGEYRKKEVQGILNTPGYEFMMVMVYAHPIVSLLRNFGRDRKLPIVGVLSTWNSVYKNIKGYQDKLGNNFLLLQSPPKEHQKEVDKFNKAVASNRLSEYFEELVSSDPKKFSSSFRKSDDGLSPEELEKREKSRAKSQEILKSEIDKLEKQYNEISNIIKKHDNSEEEIKNKVKTFSA